MSLPIPCMRRIIDYDDWCVSREIFDYVSSIFGPFSVDRFASLNTAKCPRFYSKFWFPGSEGVDAFSTSWAAENNWLVPPVYLISRTILHLGVSRAGGVLLVPKWLSAVFWPILFSRFGSRFSVKQVLEFTDPSSTFAPSRLHTIVSPFRFRSSVLVVRLNAS